MGERWDAFNAAAGPRRFVIGGIISAVVAASDHLWPGLGASMTTVIGIPSWALAIIVALALVDYWLLEYLVKLRRAIKGARFELAKLRSEGVAIRNDGISAVTDVASWVNWEKRALEWNEKVCAALKKISEGDAEWFAVLDVVPPPRIGGIVTTPAIQTAHEKLYREHDFRLRRLGKMIQRLWGNEFK